MKIDGIIINGSVYHLGIGRKEMRKFLVLGASLAIAGCATLKEEIETRFGDDIQEGKEKIRKVKEVVEKKVKEAKDELSKKE